MGEHNHKQALPPIPQTVTYNFKSFEQMAIYCILDRITTDLQSAEAQLRFMKQAAPTMVDDDDINIVAVQKTLAIKHRDDYYKKISSGIVLPTGVLPK